jgi:hypothetical protein
MSELHVGMLCKLYIDLLCVLYVDILCMCMCVRERARTHARNLSSAQFKTVKVLYFYVVFSYVETI